MQAGNPYAGGWLTEYIFREDSPRVGCGETTRRVTTTTTISDRGEEVAFYRDASEVCTVGLRQRERLIAFCLCQAEAGTDG